MPRATKTMAVTESLMPSVHPKYDATSPITAVTTPMPTILITKHKYPPAMSVTIKKNLLIFLLLKFLFELNKNNFSFKLNSKFS